MKNGLKNTASRIRCGPILTQFEHNWNLCKIGNILPVFVRAAMQQWLFCNECINGRNFRNRTIISCHPLCGNCNKNRIVVVSHPDLSCTFMAPFQRLRFYMSICVNTEVATLMCVLTHFMVHQHPGYMMKWQTMISPPLLWVLTTEHSSRPLRAQWYRRTKGRSLSTPAHLAPALWIPESVCTIFLYKGPVFLCFQALKRNWYFAHAYTNSTVFTSQITSLVKFVK